MKIKKTNAMRILDQKKYAYNMYEYSKDEIEKGIDVPTQIDQPAQKVFKTIVLESGNDHFVAVIPIYDHIDMKKAAKALGVKRVELLHLNKLFDLTGYVRGGCSPLGMKKQFPTVIADSAQSMDEIIVSAGKIGQQMGLNPLHLKEVTRGSFAAITVDETHTSDSDMKSDF